MRMGVTRGVRVGVHPSRLSIVVSSDKWFPIRRHLVVVSHQFVKLEKVLFTKMEEVVGEHNPFRDYLVKVFKKKIKRKVSN